jgi:hypothetical protein
MNATDTAPSIEHRVGETGFVTIRLADWDADVRAVDGATVTVRNADAGPLPADLRVDQSEGAITIGQVDTFGISFSIGRRPKGVRLEIDVPAKARVAISTASGDAQARGLHGPVNARTASGDLTLVDIAGDLQAETVSGDVLIRLDGPTGLAVKTVSGDAVIEGGRADRFAYTSTSGDLRLISELGDGPHAIQTVSGDAVVTTRNGIRVAAQTVTGDLSSEMPHSSEGRPGRRSLIVGEGRTALQFRSVSGDLRVVGPKNGEAFAIPKPPAPPAPPEPLGAVAALTDVELPDIDLDAPAEASVDDDARLDILRALERGEIDVDEATTRLASLDGPTDG